MARVVSSSSGASRRRPRRRSVHRRAREWAGGAARPAPGHVALACGRTAPPSRAPIRTAAAAAHDEDARAVVLHDHDHSLRRQVRRRCDGGAAAAGHGGRGIEREEPCDDPRADAGLRPSVLRERALHDAAALKPIPHQPEHVRIGQIGDGRVGDGGARRLEVTDARGLERVPDDRPQNPALGLVALLAPWRPLAQIDGGVRPVQAKRPGGEPPCPRRRDRQLDRRRVAKLDPADPVDEARDVSQVDDGHVRDLNPQTSPQAADQLRRGLPADAHAVHDRARRHREERGGAVVGHGAKQDEARLTPDRRIRARA